MCFLLLCDNDGIHIFEVNDEICFHGNVQDSQQIIQLSNCRQTESQS